MSDLDRTFQAAIGAATARVVAPPLADIERHARARRVRRTAAVAVLSVAALASVAIAVPRLTGPHRAAPAASGGRKPFDGIRRDAAAFEQYLRCDQALHTAHVVNGHPQPLGLGPATASGAVQGDVDCLHAAGYETPAPPRPFLPRCVGALGRREVATGTVAGAPWRYDAFRSDDVGACTELTVRGHVVDAGTPDSFGYRLRRIDGSDTYLLEFMTRDGADHVALTVDGSRQELRGVLFPSTFGPLYAVAVVPKGGSVDVDRVDYDASGAVLDHERETVVVPR